MMHVQRWCVSLLCAGLGAHAGVAQSLAPAMSTTAPDVIPAHVRVMQDSLVAEARRNWHAEPARLMPGWRDAVRDVERAVGRPWHGLPAVVLVVPDDGHGFPCDGARCLGRFLGARLSVPDGDSVTVMLSSIVLIAESTLMRRDVWTHELTHALLTQHGLLEESRRHDRRYFRSDRALDALSN